MIAGAFLTLLLVPSGAGDLSMPSPPPLSQSQPPPPAAPPSSLTPSLRGTPFRLLGNPGEWVTPEDYPIDALRDFKEGRTGFRLMFDTSGQVTDCIITSPSGTPSLDAKACEVLRLRARFAPARDKNGKPLAGSYSSRVRWMIPDTGAPGMLMPSDVVVDFDVTSTGKVINCRSRDMKRNRDVPGPCATLLGRTAPSTGGKPVHVTLRSATEINLLDKEPVEVVLPSGGSSAPN